MSLCLQSRRLCPPLPGSHYAVRIMHTHIFLILKLSLEIYLTQNFDANGLTYTELVDRSFCFTVLLQNDGCWNEVRLAVYKIRHKVRCVGMQAFARLADRTT